MSSIERYLHVSLKLAISESKIDPRPHNYQDMLATGFDDQVLARKHIFSFRGLQKLNHYLHHNLAGHRHDYSAAGACKLCSYHHTLQVGTSQVGKES